MQPESPLDVSTHTHWLWYQIMVGKANKPILKDYISLHGQSEATLLQMHQFGWMVTGWDSSDEIQNGFKTSWCILWLCWVTWALVLCQRIPNMQICVCLLCVHVDLFCLFVCTWMWQHATWFGMHSWAGDKLENSSYTHTHTHTHTHTRSSLWKISKLKVLKWHQRCQILKEIFFWNCHI
jgi:hypothetical protein